ncbi:Tyrosine-protein kinase PR2 [Toxocara canis]|uniref:non-specific protein-tyrosine kinase n=1 Tax=Toxocara canis TaxID=6265 RepID=A0A0B2VBP2_TOXCA|nr:Tyrosine-protein kinase PR2 [Toxocara canis]
MSEHSYSLGDLLSDADLLCYEHSMRTVLRLRDAMDVIYADEKDLSGIGMSRPEQKRLRAAYQKLFPKSSIMDKLKKRILGKGEAKRIEIAQPDQDQHVIPIERVTLCRELGNGEFGSVFQAAWNTTGSANGERIQVAVKCVSSDKLLANPNNFLQEAAIMHKMRHDCVVRLFGVVLDTKGVMLVSELAPCGSLLECLQKPALRDSFFVDTLCDFAQQIALGMEYLSNERLIHRDLAARNVLVFSADKVKISDFGLSRSLGMGEDYYRSEFTDGLKLPIAWCAPESINFLKFTSASDVWSYGVTLFEMFSYGLMPWAGFTGAQILAAIDYPRMQRLECPDACPADMYKLMLQCWAHKAEERPSFTDIVHQFPDIFPQAVITVSACQDGVLDHLQFTKNEVILVLDNPSAYPDGYYWRGCMRSGRTGLFRPAETVARLGAENPGGKLDHTSSLIAAFATEKQLNADKEKDKCKKKKLVISEPQGELRHTCHVGIDGTSFGLLQVDKNELARALPPSIVASPKNQRRSPSVPLATAPSLPSPSTLSNSTHASSEILKPEVLPRGRGSPAIAHKSVVPPPLPSAPKPMRATATPSAPPLSEPNSTCSTLMTALTDVNSTNDSSVNEEQLLLALSRSHHAHPAFSTVKYIGGGGGANNEGISCSVENSDGLIEEILNEMNTDITNFSLSTTSTLDDCAENRPLLGDVAKKPPPSKPTSTALQSVCRVMSEAELEKWESKVDREHRKANKRLEDERRKEINCWRNAARRDDEDSSVEAKSKSFSSSLSATKAPSDWTEDAQNAYKLLVQCGDELKSPTTSHSSALADQCQPVDQVQLRMRSGSSSTPRPSMSPPPVPIVSSSASASGITNKEHAAVVGSSVDGVSFSASESQAIRPHSSDHITGRLPPTPLKSNRIVSADDSSLSPLRQLRGPSGSVAHNFRARSVQPVEERIGKLPPPVPPKPKNKIMRGSMEEYPSSQGGFASSVANSALFSGVISEDVMKF